MKIKMNIYYDPNDLIRNKQNITNDVFNRFEENNCQDIYNYLYSIEDEDIEEAAQNFLDNMSIEEIKKYVTVDEDSVQYDDYETSECDYEMFAYLVTIDFDIDKLINKIKDEENIER